MNFEKLAKWIPPEERDYGVEKEYDKIMQDMPLMTNEGTFISGTGENKKALLYDFYSSVKNSVYSKTVQTIGDCVSFGWAKAIETYHVCEIATNKSLETWLYPLCTEWIYGTSRVLVGRGRLKNGDGSIGAWAAKAVQEHGTLHRKQYQNFDLRRYSGARAKKWGYRGLPTELEVIADETPVNKVALVSSYEEARDCLANLYPIAVCSRQGFSSKRDSQGFLKPKGRWSHCMAITALDDSSRRPGCYVDNRSWGTRWVSGPKKDNGPDGGGWVDAEVIDKMLKQGDSYAIAGYSGFVENSEWSLF